MHNKWDVCCGGKGGGGGRRRALGCYYVYATAADGATTLHFIYNMYTPLHLLVCYYVRVPTIRIRIGISK